MAAIPFSQKKFLFIFIAWWLIWSTLQAWILYDLGFDLQLCITDSAISNFVLALACVIIGNSLAYYLPRQQRYIYLLVLCLLTAGACLLATKYVLTMVITASDYPVFLSKSLPVRFSVSFLVIGCMTMISVMWNAFEDQKTSVQRRTEAEQLTKDAELYKLRQQLQPHFLFNSLNSINALIGIRPQEARTMVQQLSDFLRGTLKREEQQWISVEEELEYLRLYLDIERVRFGNRLSTAFDTDHASLQMKIPAMLLQPLVENAIKFGLYDTTGDTVVSINSTVENGLLVISVQNPFDSETSQPRRGTGFGLHSIQRRLYLLFARQDLLVATAQDNIFTVTVKIPQPANNNAGNTEKKI
ncbi:MAG: histidine kinase [Chitinophagaceae bacterium]